MKLTFQHYTPARCFEDVCPIIFLHAMLDTRKTWNEVAPSISRDTGRRVYSLDARNHGDSPWSEDFSLQLMANDIREFLSDYKIPKAIFIGSNIGGSIAMKLALESPQMVEKLIVENMVPDPYPDHESKFLLNAINVLESALSHIPRGVDMLTAKTAVNKFFSESLAFMVQTRDDQFLFSYMNLKEENGTFKWEANLDAIKRALLTHQSTLCGMTGTYNGDTLFLYGPDSDMKVKENAQIPHFFPRAVFNQLDVRSRRAHYEAPAEFVKHVAYFIKWSVFRPDFGTET